MSHYYSSTPGGAGRLHEVAFQIDGRHFSLTSAEGVFSAERLDAGTAVLLRKAPLPTADQRGALLDLGCGYGPVTCVLADSAPLATVWAVDPNPRARALTERNAAAVGAADRVRVTAPDQVPPELRFAQIWSNPPVRIGKPALREMLGQWLPRLAPHGVAWLVMARHLGGDSWQRWLTEQGWQVTRYASQKGYRVLRVARELPEAVVAVVLDGLGRALVAERGPAVVRPGYWAPLSGRLEAGETQAEAVVREVREEVGLTVRPVRKVWQCPTDDGAYLLHWWLATVIDGTAVPDGQEVAAVRWVAPGEFGELSPTFSDDRVFFDEILPGLPEVGARPETDASPESGR